MRSDKPEAERFQDWLTDEVLPALRRTGTYSIGSSPVLKTARRLKCDQLTAIKRVQNSDINKASNGRIASEGGCPNDHMRWHNASHRGKTGLDAKGLRKALEIRGRRTPLDFSSMLVLTLDSHAKILTERMIAESSVKLDRVQQAELLERTTRELVEDATGKLGGGSHLGIRDDPKRGKILDVVPRSITTD